jgi:hypothetical protein
VQPTVDRRAGGHSGLETNPTEGFEVNAEEFADFPGHFERVDRRATGVGSGCR